MKEITFLTLCALLLMAFLILRDHDRRAASAEMPLREVRKTAS